MYNNLISEIYLEYDILIIAKLLFRKQISVISNNAYFENIFI